MGPEAKGGTAETTGAMGIASKKQVPVTKDAKPGEPTAQFYKRLAIFLRFKMFWSVWTIQHIRNKVRRNYKCSFSKLNEISALT